jgi:outer membrane protein TolC
MNNIKCLVLVFGFLILEFPVMAQCQTLDQIIQEFTSTNNELITLQEKLKIQYKLYQNNQDKWKPNAKLDLALPYSNSIESVVSGDGSVNYLKRNYLNPLLSLSTSKKITQTGGEIGVNGSVGLFQNFINSNKQFNANWFNIYVSQPLFAYNTMKAERNKQRLALSVDSIQYYQNKETQLKKIVEAILDYEIAKQKINYNEQLVKQANYTLKRIKVMHENGRALADDTILVAYNVSKSNVEKEKLLDNAKAKSDYLTSQLNHAYKSSMCDVMNAPTLAIDTSELKQRYITYSFQKEMILDSLDVFENTIKMKKAHGITTSMSLGIGANKTSSDFNQLYQSPSQRQNVTINTSVPITGWQTYKRNNEIALIEQQNYQRTKQDIENNASLWTTETYNNYKYLLKSYNLAKGNLEGLQTLANSVYKRFEFGKVPFTEYNNVVNEISTTQQNLLDIVKQLYLLRFELRAKTLYDYALAKEVF